MGNLMKGDIVRVTRAAVTNQLAHFMPRTYVRLTGETGRGRREESVADVGEYFWRCFEEYFEKLQVPSSEIGDYLDGKTVLEYGPGDIPAVSLLMYAFGAGKVCCVDRFQLVTPTEKNQQILQYVIDKLPPEARQRAAGAFETTGEPGSGLKTDCVEYFVRPNGLSGLHESVDLIISRAVLEHVNDLWATFQDMQGALRPGAVAVHEVDLKSHGLHKENPLDFLTWPAYLWTLMYSHKGAPNRWRVTHYRRAIEAAGLKVDLMEANGHADSSDLEFVRPQLAEPFRDLPGDDLLWLGIWMVLHKQTGEGQQ